MSGEIVVSEPGARKGRSKIAEVDQWKILKQTKNLNMIQGGSLKNGEPQLQYHERLSRDHVKSTNKTCIMHHHASSCIMHKTETKHKQIQTDLARRIALNFNIFFLPQRHLHGLAG
jgi:hypothetical protein